VPLLQSGLKPSSPEIRRLLPGIETGKKGRKKEIELPVYQGRGGEWRLTTAERKRILLNNIYGVDIDRQAVEVTKLSLLLKVLEGENDETISKQLKLFQERALPDLSRNIKCGNSLIGWDILNDNPGLTQEEIDGINPFDWEKEFPEIMQAGGFHIVIGNPPYVRQEILGKFKGYFQGHYRVYHGIADLYVYFIERGISLLKDNGIFSYIVANKWMGSNYGKPLRRWLKDQHIEEIVDFKDLPVFQGATTYPCIIRISKNLPATSFNVTQLKTLNFANLKKHIEENSYTVDQKSLDDKGWPLADNRTQTLLETLKARGMPLGKYVDGKIYNGVKTGFNGAFIIDTNIKDKLISEDSKSADIIKPLLIGRDIKRYQPVISNRYILCIPWHFPLNDDINILSASEKAETQFKKEYPAVYNYMLASKTKLLDRDHAETGIKYEWYALQRPKTELYLEFEKPKIVYTEIAARGQFTLDLGGHHPEATTYMLGTDSKYLLGILNSNLWTFLFSKSSSEIRGGFYRWKHQYMSPLPIRTIDHTDPADVASHDRMVSLVDQMLSLHKQLKEARTPHEQTSLQRQIEATDGQIDALVYELYGLTEEEIRIVEGT
jgi:hypothetical protein